MAMLEPNIAPMLRVTNEQAQQVAALVTDTQKEQQAAYRDAGQERNTATVKVEAIAAQANEKAAALLAPEQRRTWDRLIGDPFRPDLSADPKADGADPGTPKR